MIKSILTAAALVMSMTASSFAMDEMKCDDASIMKMTESAMAMKDPAMKESMEMAMKEVDMAKMAMKDSKMDECKMHLDNAMKASAPKM